MAKNSAEPHQSFDFLLKRVHYSGDESFRCCFFHFFSFVGRHNCIRISLGLSRTRCRWVILFSVEIKSEREMKPKREDWQSKEEEMERKRPKYSNSGAEKTVEPRPEIQTRSDQLRTLEERRSTEREEEEETK